MESVASFYRGKRVLITGYTGFKGSWLSQILLAFGAKVSGLALEPSTTPNLFTVLELRDQMSNHIGDVREARAVEEAIDEERPEIIFHLAAQPLVRESYDDPRYTFETNLLGTLNVLESVRGKDFVKALVVITTDKVYKNKEQDAGYTEEDELGGYDPYSASKACAELIIESYRSSFFNPEKEPACLICTARAGNVVGGGDWSKDRLIPDMVRSIIERKEPVIIRSPRSVRPWQHVLEPLYGYLLLGKRLAEGDKGCACAWNFAPEHASTVTVEEIIKKGIALLGKGTYRIEEEPRKHETKVLRLDARKAKASLSWRPLLTVDETLDMTFTWYKEHSAGRGTIRELTADQIKNFFQRAEHGR